MTTSSLHSPGFWDHMPPAHKLNIVMNDDNGFEDEPLSEQTLPARPVRSARRSHTNAWIFGLAVTATGAAVAVAVAHVHDPRSIGYKLDAALAEVKDLGHKDKPAEIAAPDAAPTAVAQQQEASQPAAPAPVSKVAQADTAAVTPQPTTPLPAIAPAAGRRTAVQPAPAPAAAPRQLATLSTPSSTQELRATDNTPPAQMAPISPVQPITPVTPVAPVALPASAPVIIVPPPMQPASAPPPQSQLARTDAATGELTR